MPAGRHCHAGPAPLMRSMSLKMLNKLCRSLHMNRSAAMAGILACLVAVPALAQHGGGSAWRRRPARPTRRRSSPTSRRGSRREAAGWLLRGQFTGVLQGHPAFRSPYRGDNSLRPSSPRNTQSLDLLVGRRLWARCGGHPDPPSPAASACQRPRRRRLPEQRGLPARQQRPLRLLVAAFLRQTIDLSARPAARSTTRALRRQPAARADHHHRRQVLDLGLLRRQPLRP